MKITEPTTMVTDYLLAIVTLILAGSLFREGRIRRRLSVLLCAGAFCATASAAIVGGTIHRFTLYLDAGVKAAMWKVTLYAIGITSFCMFTGIVFATLAGRVRRWLLVIVGVEFAAYVIWTATHTDFRFAIYQYGSALIGTVVLLVLSRKSRGSESAKWIIAGVLVSFVAAGIQQSGFDLH